MIFSTITTIAYFFGCKTGILSLNSGRFGHISFWSCSFGSIFGVTYFGPVGVGSYRPNFDSGSFRPDFGG